MLIMRRWAVRHAALMERAYGAMLGGMRMLRAARARDRHQAPAEARDRRRARGQGLALRLPDVRQLRAVGERHVLPDELSEERCATARAAACVPTAAAKPSRTCSASGWKAFAEPGAWRQGALSLAPTAPAEHNLAGKSTLAAAHRRRGRDGAVRRVRGAGAAVRQPARGLARERRVRRHRGIFAAGLGRSRRRSRPTRAVSRLRRRAQRHRWQSGANCHMSSLGVSALLAAGGLRAGDADRLPRPQPHRDPGRHPRRRGARHPQCAVPHRRSRLQWRSSRRQARRRSRQHDAPRHRAQDARRGRVPVGQEAHARRRACSSAPPAIRSRRIGRGPDRAVCGARSPPVRNSCRRSTASISSGSSTSCASRAPKGCTKTRPS